MKKRLMMTLALLLAGGMLLAGCASSAGASGAASSGSVPEESVPQSSAAGQSESTAEEVAGEMVYRGEVTTLQVNGDIEVAQMPGHDYGQASIVFHTGGAAIDNSNGEVAQGAYVEVVYDGRLTRSMPAQGTALSVKVIASFSEGIVQNGTVESVQPMDDSGFRLSVLPISAGETGGADSQIVLIVPEDALEGLQAGDLQEGVQVSAVTQGIAALSQPPQMPVLVLLPYTEAAAG